MDAYSAIDLFYLITHLILGLTIFAAYFSLSTILMPHVVNRFSPHGNNREAIEWGGRAFFMGCAVFHALAMTIFFSIDMSDMMHVAFHITEAIQAFGAWFFIRAILFSARKSSDV